MRFFQIAGVSVIGGVVIWLVLGIVLFNTCFNGKGFAPINIQALCQKEKNILLLRIFNMTRDEPQCKTFLKMVEKMELVPENKPIIYLITPTYARPVQKAELTRMSHTLLLVPNVHWIVVEDSENKTTLVTNFLNKSRISFTHLNIPSPPSFKKDGHEYVKCKGVLQRNLALSWIRNHIDPKSNGVVYFADDDNTYDLELFEEMRYTSKVSVWPVALAGGLMVERPLVENGKVIGWNAKYKPKRPFAIDMAGFAVNLTLLYENPKAAFSLTVPEGYQESTLLENLVTINELEPKANNCTKVLVWHTRTQLPNLEREKNLTALSSFGIEI